jgi:hypothetical protein
VAIVFAPSAAMSQMASDGTADLGKLLGAGVQCLTAPSTGYRPGTIFRIDENKVSYFVNQQLAERIPTHTLPAAVGQLSGRQQLSVGVLAWLLNASKVADLHASADSKRTIDARFGRVTWEVTNDDQIDDLLATWFAQYKHKRLNSTYYVVREAWLAESLQLKMTKGLTDDLGGEVSLKKILQLNASFKYEPSSEYNLSAPFPEALRVCIKPEVWVPIVGVGRGEPLYRTEPVRSKLTVSRQDIDRD